MSYFEENYRIESCRLRNRDYSAPGFYFVTICTKDRTCSLGEVTDAVIHRSRVGDIVAEELQKTGIIRSNVELDEWVVMPNHVHAIIRLLSAFREVKQCSGASREGQGAFGLKPRSLSSIVGQIKSVCTKRIRAIGVIDFAWQERFFDHIIRDEDSLISKRQYIRDNPLRWEFEKDSPENIEM